MSIAWFGGRVESAGRVVGIEQRRPRTKTAAAVGAPARVGGDALSESKKALKPVKVF